MKVNKKFRDNVAIILMTQAAMLTTPAIVHAAWEDYHPINFSQAIKSERGAIAPIGLDAVYLNDAETCDMARKDWGWSDCSGVDQIVFGMGPNIDTIMLREPITEGYVKLDDFFKEHASSDINSMAEQLKEAYRDQSKRSGKKIEFTGWRLFPKADHSQGIIYYAYGSKWDGLPQVNIRVTLLDRYGYVVMDVIPVSEQLDETAIKAIVDEAVATYKPEMQSSYAAYQPGDKLATYGGLGVLATVLGVKYGKAASAGLLAMLAIFLKKGGFLLALPFIWLGRALFGRRGD